MSSELLNPKIAFGIFLVSFVSFVSSFTLVGSVISAKVPVKTTSYYYNTKNYKSPTKTTIKNTLGVGTTLPATSKLNSAKSKFKIKKPPVLGVQTSSKKAKPAVKKTTLKAKPKPASKLINLNVDNLVASIKVTTKDLKATGTSELGGDVKIGKTLYLAGGTTFYINDSGDARVGVLTASKGIDTNGAIHNGVDNVVTISDKLDLTGGKLYNSKGDLVIDDNLTVTGTSTFNGALSVAGNINPSVDNSYTLGTSGLRWQTVHVGPGSLVVHNDNTNTLLGTLGFTGNRVSLITDAASALWLATGTNQGLFVNTGGNLGVGTSNPGSQLSVAGGSALGSTFAPFIAPSNGLIVQGNVGLGSSNPFNALDVSGAVAFGSLPIAALPQANSAYFSGNVGIGTTIPSQALQVVGNALVAGNLGVGTTAPTQTLDLEVANGIFTFSSTIGPKQLTTAGSTNFALMPGGNVGIGVTSPSQKLAVSGNGLVFGSLGIGTTAPAQALDLELANGIFTFSSTIGPKQIITGGTTNLGLLPGGNVGIGTTAPRQTLEVAGTGYLSGNLGVGATTPVNRLDVAGSLAVGSIPTVALPQTNEFYVSGNVGIGTTAPSLALAVQYSASTTSGVSITNSSSAAGTSSQLDLFNDVNSRVGIGINSSGHAVPSAAFVWDYANTDLRFGTNNAEQMRIKNNGNVGIGVTGPVDKLDVAGSVAFGATLNTSLPQSNSAYFGGNVGIGTTNPPQALSVSGNGLVFSSLGIGTTAPAQALDLEAAVANLTFSSSVGNHQIITGGTTNLGLLPGGNVGVGTTNPTALFSVGASSQFQVNSGGLVFTQAGSQGAPSFSFVNNTTSGLSNPLANTLDLSTGGISRIRVDSSGNVGIGLSGPASTLSVNGNGGFGSTFSFFAAPSNGLIVQGNSGIGTSTPRNAFDVSGAAAFGSLPTAALPQANQAYFSGNLGIGTTTPTQALAVSGNGLVFSSLGVGTTAPAQALDLEAAVANLTFSSSVGAHQIITGGTSNLALVPGGNVGIGTTAAFNKLDVSGSVSFGVPSTMPLPQTNSAYFSGNVGVGTTAPRTTVDIVGSVGIGTTAPSALTPLPSSTALYVQGNVGIGTTNPGANNMKILGSLCVKGNDAACAGSAAGNIYATNTTVQAADVAENYVSSRPLGAGTVVELAGDGNNMAVVESSGTYAGRVLGVISTAPGLTLNSDAFADSTHPFIVPLALSGRVPVRISQSSPAIKAGDFLAASGEPGRATKATQSGLMIGRALEDWVAGKDSLMAYVYNQYADLSVLSSLSSLATSSSAGSASSTSSQAVTAGTSNANAGLASANAAVNSSTSSATPATAPAAASPTTPALNDAQKSALIEDAVSIKIDKPVTLYKDVSLLGRLSGRDLFLTGKVSLGFLALDGADNSLTTSGADLKLQNSPLAGKIDLFNGKLTISPSGDLTTSGTLTASGVKTGKLTITEAAEASGSAQVKASVGSVTIAAGQTSVEVKTSALTDKSLIFTSTSSPVAVGAAKKDADSFAVSLKEALSQDLKVNWWIIN